MNFRKKYSVQKQDTMDFISLYNTEKYLVKQHAYIPKLSFSTLQRCDYWTISELICLKMLPSIFNVNCFLINLQTMSLLVLGMFLYLKLAEMLLILWISTNYFLFKIYVL